MPESGQTTPGAVRRTLRAVDAAYWGTGIADDVPALTYYLLISMVPLVAGSASLALLLQQDRSAVEVGREVGDGLPEAVRPEVESLVTAAAHNSALLLFVTIVGMLWTTSGAIGVVERVLARITSGARHPRVGGKLRNMALGGILSALLVVAATAGPIAAGVEHRVGLEQASAYRLAALPFAIAGFALLFRLAPRDPTPWPGCIVGGLIAGPATLLVPSVVGLVFAQFQSPALGVVLATFAIVTFAFWLLANAVLIGAFAATHRTRRGA